jgi:hypothetical protein
VSVVTDLQHETLPETVPAEHHRSALVWWLAGGLAVALLAVIGLGAWVYYDHNQTTTTGLTSTQAAAVAAVDAHMAAMNANDPAAIANTATSDVVWTTVFGGKVMDGPYVGKDYLALMASAAPTFSIQKLGDPAVGGDSVVAVPTYFSANKLGASGTGVTVFTVRAEGGQLKVAEITVYPDLASR